jgi:post-segregation antitoxin (ccd killing protein)
MKRKFHLQPQQRRTTLTLPVASLPEAERIARARNLNLSAVIAEALNAGLRQR